MTTAQNHTPLVVTICATKSYTYAMKAQARHVVSCLSLSPERWPSGVVVLVGDTSENLREIKTLYDAILPGGWSCSLVGRKEVDGLKNYGVPAQMLIARLRSLACDEARRIGAELCWSLDSDVLPPPNALRCLADMLGFDGGYYSVAASPYPSQGGGDWLCGRGTEQQTILPDIYENERNADPELLKRIKKSKDEQARFVRAKQPAPEAWIKEFDAIKAQVDQSPPKGNVFALNAVQFRKRGWFSAAYPGVGKGAVVPSDWTGFGCTLMNREALALAQWDGYDGRGTEDLYIVWRRWYPAGLRICAVPHVVSDHVIRNPGKKMEVVPYVWSEEERERLFKEIPDHLHQISRFETHDRECVGHLRMESRPWYEHAPLEAPAGGNATDPD